MTCHLCGADRDTCGCWETIAEYPLNDEETAALLSVLALVEKHQTRATEH